MADSSRDSDSVFVAPEPHQEETKVMGQYILVGVPKDFFEYDSADLLIEAYALPVPAKYIAEIEERGYTVVVRVVEIEE